MPETSNSLRAAFKRPLEGLIWLSRAFQGSRGSQEDRVSPITSLEALYINFLRALKGSSGPVRPLTAYSKGPYKALQGPLKALEGLADCNVTINDFTFILLPISEARHFRAIRRGVSTDSIAAGKLSG